MQISTNERQPSGKKHFSFKSHCFVTMNVRVILLTCLLFVSSSGLFAQRSRVSAPLPTTPTITVQPRNANICPGSGAFFQITATDAVTYQWQIKTGDTFVNITYGGTYYYDSPERLIILNTDAAMDGFIYRCVLFNTDGLTISNEVSLNFFKDPVVNRQPSAASVLVNGNTTFMVTAYHAPTYQWQVDRGAGFENLVESAPYSGSKSDRLTITGATAAMNGYLYQVVANGVCGSTATSSPVALAVSPPPQFTSQPLASIVCAGSNTTFTAAASDAVSYRWMVDRGAGFISLDETSTYSGTRTTTLTITNAPTTLNSYQYKLVATGVSASSASSAPATLSVIGGGTLISQQPTDLTRCTGGNASFSVTASEEATFQWQVKTGSEFSDITDGDVYSGAASSSLAVSLVNESMHNNEFRCQVTGSCAAATSSIAKLTVSAPGLWLGAISGEWDDAANWSCGKVPDQYTDVVIKKTDDFMPEISSYDAVCRNLTIESDAALYVYGMLDIKGSVTNEGTFDRSGPIIFSGTSQVIPAGEYEEIDIMGGGTATLGGNVSIDGLLILDQGFLQLGDYDLTLSASRGTINGGSPDSFVVTNGKGQLKAEGVGTPARINSVWFPIGASPSSFTPVFFENAGTSDVFGARVIDGIFKSYNGNNEPSEALTTFNVNKTWFISEETPGGSNATITFQWSGQDEQDDFVRSSCFASHYDNGKWVLATASEAQQNEEVFSTLLSGVTTFSPFGVGSTGSALPLKLISFKAALNNENVALEWQTTSEVNTAGFDIEVSGDALHFRNIGFVKSYDNNSIAISKYDFNSEIQPGVSTSYYRLKMLDNDGSFAYSKIITVHHSEVTVDYQIFPNPVAQEYLSVKSAAAKSGPLEIIIFDASGMVQEQMHVESKPLNDDPLRIPVTNLQRGPVYIIQITEIKTGSKQSFKFYRK